MTMNLTRIFPPGPLACAVAMAAFALPAAAQTVYKCTTPNGTVTYQETPCPGKEAQKRVDTSHGSLAEEKAARELLEREAYRGDPLAAEFTREARERDRREALERREREERLRREREKEQRATEEAPDWMPPWGWPGRPGLAKPKVKPTP